MDVLKFIMKECGRKGGTTEKVMQKRMPVKEKVDADLNELGKEVEGTENGAPILYLFFKKGLFEAAEVCADNCIIHLQASTVVNAIIGYIGVYFVFHVGYAPEHENFMYFLQYAFLGERKIPGSSVALNKFIHKFEKAIIDYKESKGFKKLCV